MTMKVDIYTTPTCGYCHQAKRFLAERGIAFSEHDVSVDSAMADEMVRLTGQMGVQVIVINGEPIIGFDRSRIEQLIANAGQAQRVSLGLKVANNRRFSEYPGAYIGAVAPSSPGEKARLKAGDVIVNVNDSRVSSASDLEQIIASLRPGSKLALGFVRGGETLKSEITV